MRKKIFLSTLLLLSAQLVGQETWNIMTGGNWGTNTNWNPAVVPNGVGVSATFGNIITASSIISLDISPTVGTIAIDSGFDYVFQPSGGNFFTMSVASGSAQINLTSVNGSASHVFLTPMTLSSNLAITSTMNPVAAQLFLQGVMSGPGSVSITGVGITPLFNISANNTYGGGTTITNAVVGLGVSNALPPNRALTLATNGFVDLNALSQSIGTLTGDGTTTIDLSNTTLTTTTSTASSYAGHLISTASSNLIVQGTGTLNLNGNTNFQGTAQINGGILRIGFTNALNPAVNVTVTSPGAFDLNGFSQMVANLTGNGNVFLDTAATVLTVTPTVSPDTFSGIISGPGALTVVGPSTFRLTNVSSYTGGTTVNGIGVLQLTANNALFPLGSMTINSGTLDVSTTTAQSIGTLSGLGNISLGSAVLTINGLTNAAYGGSITAAPGSVIYQGPATLILNGNSFYTGGTTINGGIIQLGTGHLQITGNLTINSPGLFDLNSHNQVIGALSGTGNITLGTATLTLNPFIATTYSGSISQTGALLFMGPGFFTMLGANTYSGGTTITGGILQGNTLSLQGNINNLAAGTLIFNQMSPGTFSGALTGTGQLVVTGSSPLTFLGAQTQGNTTINGGGQLIIGSGANLTSPVTVASGGTLSGTGTITGNVIDQGTVDVDLGKLSITGNYNQAAGSRFNVTLSSTQSGLLAVTGTVSIAQPSSVFATVTPGQYTANERFTIITSQGGPVTGTFSTLNMSNAFFTGTFLYNDPVGDVILQLSLAPFGNVIKGGNAGRIAKCLNPNILPPGSDLGAILSSMVFLPLSQVRDNLNDMQPSQLTGLKLAQENNLSLGQAAILQRQEDLSRTPCNPPMSKKNPWSLWSNLGGDFLAQDKQGSSAGFKTKTGIANGGLDARVGIFALGVAGAYSYSHLRWEGSHGSASIRSKYVGPYVSLFSHRIALNLSGLASHSEYETRRHIKFMSVNRHAHSNHTGHSLSGHADMAFLLYPAAGMTFAPLIGGDYFHLHEKGYKEKGARDLSFQIMPSHASLFRSEAGFKMAKCACRKRSKWTHDLKLSWMHTYPRSGKDLSARIPINQCTFTVKGMEPSRDFLNVATGLTAIVLKDHLTLALRYEGKFGDGLRDNSGYFQLIVRF